jgi:hypothetical protein
MPTYFVGSRLDSVVPSLTGVTDGDEAVKIEPGSYADCYVTDPVDGVRKGVTRLWSHAKVSSIDFDYPEGLALFTWYNSLGQPVVRLAGVALNLRALQMRQGDNWVTVGLSAASKSATYDVHIRVHPSQGRLAWFVNGTFASDVSGINTAAIGDIALMRLGNVQDYTGTTDFSEVLLASYNTIGHVVRRRTPSGAGTHSAWSGSWQDVDDPVTNDTNAISASAVGARSTFTAPALDATSPGNVIKAVAVAARIRNDGDVIPTNARACLRIGGVDYTAPNNMRISAGFVGSVQVFEQNPSTNAAWASISEANGEFGLLATE